jgi:parallel beta-helix repeat protein
MDLYRKLFDRIRNKRSFFLKSMIGIVLMSCIIAPVYAAIEVTQCRVISSPGAYILKNSIRDVTDPVCITITTSDVVFDGAGHSIDGIDAASSKGILIGMSSQVTRNVSIYHLEVTDWDIGISASRIERARIDTSTVRSGRGGIYLVNVNDTTISETTASDNVNSGLSIRGGARNTIQNNNFSNNGYDGIALVSGTEQTVKGNILERNNVGMFSNLTEDSFISDNTFQYNAFSGLSVRNANRNIIYNNYFKNERNVYFLNYSGYWNTNQEAGINIVGGPALGGNYWANLIGTGYSETCTDTNRDGICDQPYTLITNNVDYLPLSTVVCHQGDLNCDGDVTWTDVTLCAYMSWELVPPNPAADFDGIGGVTWNDVVLLAYFQWGLSTEL